MNIFNNNSTLKLRITSKKIKIISFVVAVFGIATLVYFYFPQISQKHTVQKVSSYQYSKPDNRPDEIKGKIVTLKRLQPAYFTDYYKMLSPTVKKPLYYPKYASLEWVTNKLNKTLVKEAQALIFIYMIFDNKDNKLIGSLAIREKNPKDPGQFYCWINENYWGGGRLREAVKLITDEYFKVKDVDSFNAHVELWNLRSYYALKKAGFKLVDFYYEDGQKTRYILEFYNPYK